jgi:hypothetical protein
VSVVRFRPWAPNKSKTYLDFSVRPKCAGQHPGQQSEKLGWRRALGGRRILVVGAIAVLRRALENPGKYPWLTQLLARRPFKVVAVALANKMARMRLRLS